MRIAVGASVPSVHSPRNLWMIRKFIGENGFCINVVHIDHRQATTDMVSGYAKEIIVIQQQEVLYSTYIIEYARKKNGVHISYNKAWRAKEKCIYVN